MTGSQDNSLAEQLVGIWSGCAFPTQETTVVFCREGRGLLFFYRGSQVGTPFVDEFSWWLDLEGRLQVRWQMRHEDDWEEDGDETSDDEADQPLQVTSGTSETVDYTLTPPPARGLTIQLGMHDATLSDTLLVYVSLPGSYEEERMRLRENSQSFDPFGPDRQIWIVGNGDWQKATPLPPKPATRLRNWKSWRIRLHGSDMNLWLFLGVVTGLAGQMGFLFGWGPAWLTKWPRILLHCVPALMLVDDEPDLAWLQQVGAAWSLLIDALAIAAAATGCHPADWPYFTAMMLIGLLPCVSLLRKCKVWKKE